MNKLLICVALQLVMLTVSVAHGKTQKQVDSGILELTIVDAATGNAVPARVELVGADDEYYIGENALLVGGDCHNFEGEGKPEFYAKEKTLARLSKEIKSTYEGKMVEKEDGDWQWKKAAHFYTAGQSKILLPPGVAKVRVFKGPEYTVGTTEIDIQSGKTTKHAIKLQRWINMPKKGWYSSDDHLHIERASRGRNGSIAKMMQAEDIHVANLVQMGKASSFSLAPQYAHGPESLYQQGDHILYAGQENPRTQLLGHTLTLGSKKALHDPENYLIYKSLWQEAVNQGGLNGFAHFATFGDAKFGLPLVLHHGLLSFIEVLQFNRGIYTTWYDVLNLGFKVAPTAGTDYPCHPNALPGHERFYTKVEGAFTYQNWLDGIRKGKTFVTTGPLLDFTINGQGVGGDVNLQNPDIITIAGSVSYDPQRDDFLGIELIMNGRLIRSIPRTDTAGKITFNLDYPIKENAWLAIRAYQDIEKETIVADYRHASQFHSAPIYVSIKNLPPLREHPRVKAIAQSGLARLANLEQRLADNNIDYLTEKYAKKSADEVPADIILRNKTALLHEIDEAKVFYMGLLE